MNYYLEPHTHTLYVYHNNRLVATISDVRESRAESLAWEVYEEWAEQYNATGGLTNTQNCVIL